MLGLQRRKKQSRATGNTSEIAILAVLQNDDNHHDHSSGGGSIGEGQRAVGRRTKLEETEAGRQLRSDAARREAAGSPGERGSKDTTTGRSTPVPAAKTQIRISAFWRPQEQRPKERRISSRSPSGNPSSCSPRLAPPPPTSPSTLAIHATPSRRQPSTDFLRGRVRLPCGRCSCLFAFGSVLRHRPPLDPRLGCRPRPPLLRGSSACSKRRPLLPDPGRLVGLATTVVPTASHANSSSFRPEASIDPALVSAPPPALLNRPSAHEPDRAQTASTYPDTNYSQNLLATSYKPFRAPLHNPLQQPLSPRQLRPGRLWNPTNSTPRAPSSGSTPVSPIQASPPPRDPKSRRPSSPPTPSIPLNHPVIDASTNPSDPAQVSQAQYPLLSLSEQRHNRHGDSPRPSLQIEGRSSGDHRVSLPRSLRHSYDEKRSSNPKPHPDPEPPAESEKTSTKPVKEAGSTFGRAVTKRARALSFGLIRAEQAAANTATTATTELYDEKADCRNKMAGNDNDPTPKGFSEDLERGPDELGVHQRQSTASMPDGATISSSDSSIMGDPDQQEIGEEWGPQHPCFPHHNPHVPVDSPEYSTTRIIRVRRDWLVQGDLAPTFSNLYPEILDPAGVTEQEFRRVVEKLNGELVPIFDPYNWRNLADGVMGLLTGWMWDDLGLTSTKSRLKSLEQWIESWNLDMEKSLGVEDPSLAPRIMPLRRTGYMSLDIQIPDPEIAPSSTPGGSRSGPQDMPIEPEPALVAHPADGR